MFLSSHSALRAFLRAWIVSATLDISSALIYFGIRYGVPAELIFKNIASGVIGEAAFRGGAQTVAAGLAFHYLIALGWTTLFYFSYPRVAFLRMNVPLVALVYGLVVWAVMNLVVIPLSRVQTGPIHVEEALIAAAFLVLFIGVPNRLIIGRYFRDTGESGK